MEHISDSRVIFLCLAVDGMLDSSMALFFVY